MTRETDDSNGRVLDASELDITEDERVRKLEDGRFVVSTDGPPVVPELESTDVSESASRETASIEDARRQISASLAEASVDYGLEAELLAEGRQAHTRVETDDVVEGFDRLVEWYANAVGARTPQEDTLGILLVESEASISYPASALTALAASHGLSADDSIAELVAACREAGGVQLESDSQQ